MRRWGAVPPQGLQGDQVPWLQSMCLVLLSTPHSTVSYRIEITSEKVQLRRSNYATNVHNGLAYRLIRLPVVDGHYFLGAPGCGSRRKRPPHPAAVAFCLRGSIAMSRGCRSSQAWLVGAPFFSLMSESWQQPQRFRFHDKAATKTGH